MDTVSVGLAAAGFGELSAVHCGTGTDVFVAAFAGLWILRDQLPGRHASLGKRWVWVQLVRADSKANGEAMLMPLLPREAKVVIASSLPMCQSWQPPIKS